MAPKTHFRNSLIPPVTKMQLQSVGIDPNSLYFSPTFQTWVFSFPVCQGFSYLTTGAIIQKLGLTPNPEA